MDTALIRDCLINNVRHGYDEAFQLVAQWTTHDPQSLVLLAGDISATVPQFVTSIGPFPYSVRANGTGARLVCRVRGNADSGETATWYLYLRGVYEPILSPGVGDDVTTSVSSSTALTWTDTDATTIGLTAEQVDGATFVFPTLDAAAGDATEGVVTLARIDVFVTTTSGSSLPELGGWYVREYVG